MGYPLVAASLATIGKNLSRDARERANLGRREPDRLDAMRARYAAWAEQMPAIPDESVAEKLYTEKDMAQPSV